jgi:hypothetical protein
MSEVVLSLLVCCAIACAPSSSRAAHTITASPKTIRVELDQRTRQAIVGLLTRQSLDVARLILRDVRPSAAQGLKGVRIFVERTDVDVKTPTDDAHYAGSFVLGLAPPETILLNIAPALSRLWESGRLTSATLDRDHAIRITLVPEAWRAETPLPRDFALTVDAIEIEIPEQP